MKRDDGRVRYVSISTADKSSIALTLTARGTSTHSSMPRPDNAIFALSRAMAKLSAYEPPLVITPATKQFFTTLARTSSAADVRLLPRPRRHRRGASAARGLGDRQGSAAARAHAKHDRAGDHQGGFRNNVIPGSARSDDQPADDSGKRCRPRSSRELRRVVGRQHDRDEASVDAARGRRRRRRRTRSSTARWSARRGPSSRAPR